MSPSTEHSAEHLVEATDLSKEFPAKQSFFGRPRGSAKVAVDKVSLSLREGEIFGLVGPNGAGKTTLIKLLTTLLRPSHGSARIAGLDVVRDEARVRGLVGLVTSNERSFYWRLTGRQNLRFFASLYDLTPREAEPWIDELFALLELEDKADARFDTYSTGMKQRLAVARGLLLKPRFLFMDEPTKGVDPVASAHLIETLQTRIIERWRPTVLITSHDLSEIERLCERIAVMHEGRFLSVGTLDELRAEAQAVDRFELEVRNLDAERLTGAARANAASGHRVEHGGNGSLRLAVEFPKGERSFAPLLRSIVEAGGEVDTCSAVRESFDDVFQKLLAREAGR